MRKWWGLVSIVAVAGAITASALARDESATPATPPPSDPFGHVADGAMVPELLGGGARPNVVVVMVDDLDRELVDHMPNLQALVREQGATFSNYFVTSALCCPSRSSFFRGQYPHNTTVRTNEDGFRRFHDLGLESSTIATWLHGAGYRTALLGKYLNGYLEAPGAGLFGYVPPGWDEWDVTGAGYFEYDYTLNHNGTLEPHGHQPSDFLSDVLTARATDFIAKTAARREPFFLELSTFAPHFPYTVPARFADQFAGVKAPRPASFNRRGIAEPRWLAALPQLNAAAVNSIDDVYRRRLQAVQGIDASIASLVDVLRRSGVLDNTYIVFTSDNGYHLGQHHLVPGKQTAYDSDIRVPLIVRGPGIPVRTVDSMAMNIDLAPTIASWAGIDPPDFVDGRSLQPLLSGDPPADWPSAVLIEHTGPATLPGDPDYQAEDNPTSYAAVRTNRYLYVAYVNGEKELYDRSVDPDELDNIAMRADGALLSSLGDVLAQLRRCAGAGCRAVTTS